MKEERGYRLYLPGLVARLREFDSVSLDYGVYLDDYGVSKWLSHIRRSKTLTITFEYRFDVNNGVVPDRSRRFIYEFLGFCVDCMVAEFVEFIIPSTATSSNSTVYGLNYGWVEAPVRRRLVRFRLHFIDDYIVRRVCDHFDALPLTAFPNLVEEQNAVP